MASFGANGLTNKGRNLQAKAQAGAELRYTKFVMGSGTLGSQSIATLTAVIQPQKTVDVTRLFVDPQAQRATVGMYFTNADVTTGFTWREIGLYAIDPDEGEILYWYGNAGNEGDYIPPGTGSDILEQTYDAIVFVGTAANVTAIIDQSLVFATTEELTQAIADSKTYTDTKFASATIPDATLTQKGKVQLTNATNSTSEALAPTAKALSTARQEAITAAATDATTKANTAETNAKNASLPRTGGALTGPLRISSWGDISASSGGYVLYGHNCYLDATGVVYRYRSTHATMGARGVVFRLGAGLEGAWMFDMGAIATTAGTAFTPTLKRILNTDDYNTLQTGINDSKQLGVEQKANVVAALNSIGVAASTSESWAQLITKMSTVIRATGNATADQVLSGATFSNAAGNGRTGAMPNRSAQSAHQQALSTEVWLADRVFFRPPNGYYDGNSWVYALTPDLRPENLLVGKNVLGVAGALQPGRKYAIGTFDASNTGQAVGIVNGLTFRPRNIIITTDPRNFASRYICVYSDDAQDFGLGNTRLNIYMGATSGGSNYVQPLDITITNDGWTVNFEYYSTNIYTFHYYATD